jgi:mono/diheme cytochrome c family protein
MAWVKHFDLELTNGAPESARRLETRILVRTSNNVYGATYRWGDSISNATLVGESGLDEAFVINDGGLLRTQIWHYPSRAECLACHTPAGGFALGFNTVQLNRDFGYPGGISNQIAFMNAAGLFSSAVSNLHSLRALAPAKDESASLEWRVRSYLAANCAACHQPGGSALGFWNAAITNFTAEAGLIHGPLNNNGGNTNARVIVPGSLTNSMLLSRIAIRGPGQMPPLSSTELDLEAINLLSRWITNDLAGGWTNTIAPLTIDIAATNNGGVVQFIHPANRAYRVESATNLNIPIQWRFLNTPENRPTYPASSNAVSVTDSTNGPQKYYRVRLSAP